MLTRTVSERYVCTTSTCECVSDCVLGVCSSTFNIDLLKDHYFILIMSVWHQHQLLQQNNNIAHCKDKQSGLAGYEHRIHA